MPRNLHFIKLSPPIPKTLYMCTAQHIGRKVAPHMKTPLQVSTTAFEATNRVNVAHQKNPFETGPERFNEIISDLTEKGFPKLTGYQTDSIYNISGGSSEGKLIPLPHVRTETMKITTFIGYDTNETPEERM